MGGGQRRSLDLYHGLSATFAVRLYTLGQLDDGGTFDTGNDVLEVRTARTEAFARAESDAMLRTHSPLSLAYLRFDDFAPFAPTFEQRIACALQTATVAIVATSTLFPLVRRHFAGPIVYQADNLEALLAPTLLAGAESAADLIDEVEASERACTRGANLVLTISDEDSALFASRYGIEVARCLAVPPLVPAIGAPARRCVRAAESRPQAVFIGSDWPPNRLAVRTLLRVAGELPEIDFAIVGSVNAAFSSNDLPANVRFTGFLSDRDVADLLARADVAVNPAEEESGVNIKMVDYALASLPILTTKRGSHGFAFLDGVHACVVDLADFPHALRAMLADHAQSEAMAARARLHLAERCNSTRNLATLAERLSALGTDQMHTSRGDSTRT